MFTHDGGDSIDNPDTTLSAKATNATVTNDDGDVTFSDKKFTAGDTITAELGNANNGDEVRVVWEDDESDTSATLTKYELQAQ